MKEGYDIYNSPIGKIYVVVDEVGIKRIELFQDRWDKYIKDNPNIVRDKDACKLTIDQLNEYFQGKRREFELPLSIKGTEFRKKVWKALCNIPYGEIRNYGEIAEVIGKPKAVRAVGQANKANMIPIIIPCHRVIGKNGKLVGYAGDNVDVQLKLLNLEKVYYD